MEAILDAIKKDKIPINPALIISDVSDARGLHIAKRLGVPAEVIPSAGSRAEYDTMILDALRRYEVTPQNGLVCLAGFMRILGSEFVAKYKNKILNIHPSLLPAFPGLYSQKQALEYGAKVSGCSVHIVDSGVDTGPVIMQAAVPVDVNDTVESLSDKILSKEHIIYPQAVELFARGKIRITGRRVIIS